MDQQIDQVIRRTKSYLYVDGTYELNLGLTLLLIDAYTLLQLNPFEWPISGIFMFLFSLVLILAGFWVINLIVRTIRRRFTYRRSGYHSTVRRKEPFFPADTMVLFAMVGFCAAVILLIVTEELGPDRWTPILAALILGVVVACAGIRSSLRRYFLLAFVGLLVGFIVAWANVADGLSVHLYMAVMGVIFTIAGIDTFLYYLKNTPLPEETAHEQ